jgi:succinate dehydrogenase/fumarate reductase flavoprotein subunit
MPDELKVARREFIKDVAAASAGVAVGSVLTSTPAAAASVPEKWDRQGDVIIVGSAIAGMCAAIEAAGGGAKVIVLEKEAQPGGLAKLAGGQFIVAGTDIQARLKVEDKPEWLYEDMMENSEMTAVPELVRTFADNGPQHITWLEQLGVNFANYVTWNANQRASRGHWVGSSSAYLGGKPSASGGLGLMLMLFKAADKRGVTTLLKHKMTRLIRANPSGPVLGVEVSNDGRMLNIKAKRAVILATGGFMANPQMCMAEDPRLTPDIHASGLPYVNCFGEGHIAAVDVGATLSAMSQVSYLPIKWGTKVYQIWEPPTFNTVPSIEVGATLVDFQRVILVKSDGKRYVNEMLGSATINPPSYPQVSIVPSDIPGHPFNEAFLNLKERPRNVWAVTDALGAKELSWPIEQIRNPDPKSGLALYPDMVATADNLGDLATKMGVDPGGLDSTVKRYNGFVDAAKDDDFGKPKPASKIAQEPFYALKLGMLRHTQRNGIRVNTKGQVIDRSGMLVSMGVPIDQEKTIPHLYAAGECASYMGHYHIHGTLAIYSFYGRVAGKNAAAEKPIV